MTGKTNPWAMTDVEAFAVGLEHFCREGGGTMRMYLVRHTNKEIAAGVKAGDPVALTLAASIHKALVQLKHTERGCTGCDNGLGGRKPHAFLIWLPGADEETLPRTGNVVVQPICAVCCAAKSDRELLADGMRVINTIFDTEEIDEDIRDE